MWVRRGAGYSISGTALGCAGRQTLPQPRCRGGLARTAIEGNQARLAAFADFDCQFGGAACTEPEIFDRVRLAASRGRAVPTGRYGFSIRFREVDAEEPALPQIAEGSETVRSKTLRKHDDLVECETMPHFLHLCRSVSLDDVRSDAIARKRAPTVAYQYLSKFTCGAPLAGQFRASGSSDETAMGAVPFQSFSRTMESLAGTMEGDFPGGPMNEPPPSGREAGAGLRQRRRVDVQR